MEKPGSDLGWINHLRVLRKLGEGANAEVYLAHHEILDLHLAVRLIRQDVLAKSGERARLRVLQEARVASRIAHPNVLRLFESGTIDGHHIYLAYEFIDGGSLESALAKLPTRRLPAPLALQIIWETAQGLDAIDRIGAIHRDIKPDNILLSRRGEVKIADLGLAKTRSGDADTIPLNVTGERHLVGTPYYMSPEQAQYQENLDIRADLYALGVLMFELLAGRTPFRGQTLFELLLAHIQEPPPDLRRLVPDIPGELVEICNTLLAKDPAERYPSPAELLSVLKWVRVSVGQPNEHETAIAWFHLDTADSADAAT